MSPHQDGYAKATECKCHGTLSQCYSFLKPQPAAFRSMVEFLEVEL